MDIVVRFAGVTINLTLIEVATFFLSFVVAFGALVTGLLARRIWLMVQGELATSWGWILPGFGVYMLASMLRVLLVFLSNPNVFPLVGSIATWTSPATILAFVRVFQAVSELVFLVLLVDGLITQYRLFSTLSVRE